ncbi:integrin alpha-6-like isoform X4 [Lethenteron reissneri]|uniref:integrin alpha-6-like isoform X4 n=1 Tax=Lethenteron reissneri TaxID=7753 RepID=UPI002AB68AAD|nr:integrin alpha-6-like isoform X4 [Lethenteron reissneri]
MAALPSLSALLLLLPLAAAFNVDTRLAVVKEGDSGSLFGFSVALHRQLNPIDRSVLLVGAPRAKALPNQHANRTGGVYQCPFTTNTDDCQRIIFDNDADPMIESKQDQWMGVTVKSQGPGGKVLACAHRYETRRFVGQPEETRGMIGRCYVLSQDLMMNEQDEMDGGSWQFCAGRPDSHEQFGVCQQGLDAGFTRDFHYIYFGAPGAYNWKGIMFLTSIDSSGADQNLYKTEEAKDKPPGSSLSLEVSRNSYLGFSMDSGKSVMVRNVLSFVAGAPRANHTGAVVVLKKDSLSSLTPEQTIYGEELASSFGYDVTLADLNNDGWLDLVVGAPQYFDRREDIGGAVYVYMNQQGGYDEHNFIRLNGTKDSMFGLAVANIGDINQDGFEDIAVGAPYDGSGKVFIYHGGRMGINPKASQAISGDDFNYKVEKFGYSITGGMDVDGNTYPDLLIGSLSDKIALLRARPVITPNILVTSDKDIDINVKNCDNDKRICIKVKACFSYRAKPVNYNPIINLTYTFEAEMDRRKQGLGSRVSFLHRGSNSPEEYVLSGSLLLMGQGRERCAEKTMQLQENIKDKLRPIPLQLTYEISQVVKTKRQATPSLQPVLDAQVPSRMKTEINFVKEGCGPDNICQSNLILKYNYCSREENDKFKSLKSMSGQQVFSLSDQKDLALEVSISNTGDDAHEAHLIMNLPDTVSYGGFRKKTVPEEVQLVCVANANGSLADCELGNPLKRGQTVSFYLILSTSGITLDTSEISTALLLTTTSEQPDLSALSAKLKVVIELALTVTGFTKPSQAKFGGEIRGESVMKTEEDVGSLIEYDFKVLNLGKSLGSLGSAFISISWPAEIPNGKWLLYLVSVEMVGTRETHCKPSVNRINELGLQSVRQKTKRQAPEPSPPAQKVAPEISPSNDKRRSLKLDCRDGTARCYTLQCPLTAMDSVAEIKLRARLWNSTFLEEYSHLDQLEIITRAKVGILSQSPNIVMKDARPDGYPVRLTVFPEKTAPLYHSIPWWIILLAVLAGVLVLALLVFLLWKCGFFARKTTEARYEAKYHKAKIEVQPSEKDKLATEA